MAKNVIKLEDRVVEYDEKSITCKSTRFDKLFPVPYMKLAENMIHMQIDASEMGTEELSRRFDDIENRFVEHGFDRDKDALYFFCLSEAVINAQKHSLKGEKGRELSLDVYVADKIALVTVSSVGEPYNIGKAVECIRTMQQDPERECGRGTAYMVSMCDLFHVYAEGNETEVTLGKIASSATFDDDLLAL